MKAVVYEKYGPPEYLELKDIEKPTPGNGEVLVKIYATAVNSWDWDLLCGKPIMIRMWGLFRPKYKILGSDIAGVVEATGKDVDQFKPGDEVFGDLSGSGWGGFAEYVCTPQDNLTIKPSEMTFEEAASLPQAGMLAFQGIYEYGKVSSGDKVLINGAGGGVGTLAIQMAKSIGAEVTAVDSIDKMGLMLKVGADHVLDYTTDDFTRTGLEYDLIIDNVATHSMTDYLRALKPTGTYVMVGGSTSSIFQAILLGSIISKFYNSTKKNSKREIKILAHKPNKDMDRLIELFQAGSIKPILDQTYALKETPEALRRLGEGKVKGKIVVSLKKT